MDFAGKRMSGLPGSSDGSGRTGCRARHRVYLLVRRQVEPATGWYQTQVRTGRAVTQRPSSV